MNRTIKFRAWNGTSMLEDFGFFDIEKPGYGLRMVNDGFRHLETRSKDEFPIIPMQFTGLLDKNGKEIFEGDVIQLDSWEPSIYKIDFDRGAFYIAKADREEVGDIKYAENSVVIGNIYENPELLNV